MFEGFVSHYLEQLESCKADLTKYRTMADPEYGAKRVALWPKKYTKQELEKMKAEEEEKRKKEEEEAEKQRQAAEEAANPKAKGG
jgi:hypothetical protein